MKIILANQVDVQQWDELAAALGGAYFHCHAEAVAEASLRGTDPLFMKTIDDADRCIGLTTGWVVTPFGWPFSRYCRSATLLAVPATVDKSVEAERAFMEALEAQLRAEGVYLVNILSHDSPNAQQVLPSLGYELSPRVEWYVDLARDEEEIWRGLRPHRRTDIRKARRRGVQTRIENTEEAYNLVHRLFEQSMQRRGVDLGESRERVRRAKRKRFQSGHIDVFVGYQNGTPVNGSIVGNFNGRPHVLVSGSSSEGLKCCGPMHTYWSVIAAYHERGAVYLNFGSDGQDKRLADFKRYFGATAVSQPAGKKTLSTFGARLHRARAILRPGRA